MGPELNREASPFHRGEQEAQARTGMRDKIEASGRKFIRDHMPDQHREFYADLPFLLAGSVDAAGRPWASLLAGRPGFIATPDARTLAVGARPLYGDPLADQLVEGASIGILGLQPETRRRNRLNGRIRSTGAAGFVVDAVQTFGNCPKYIQARSVEPLPAIDTPEAARPIHRATRFDAATRALIARADTFFIATSNAGGGGAPSDGADVSHRGGKPGFVRLEGEAGFVFPDFSGNYLFNTIGNILENPKAGFLFPDFDAGDLVYMTGAAEIVWDGALADAFDGAERLIRFRAEEIIRVENSLPFRFTFEDYSPALARTGSWPDAAEPRST